MGHGGKREGAGRKSLADEDKAVRLITQALRKIYGTEEDTQAVNSFLVDFGQTKDGQRFFAEHLLGKPKQQIDLDTNNTPLIVFQNVSKANNSILEDKGTKQTL